MSVRFTDRLAVAITLTIKGTAHVIPGGSVKQVELELNLHGFGGYVEFVMLDDKAVGGGFTDKLAADLLLQDLGELGLELCAVFDQAEAAASPKPLTLAGLVTRRSLEEVRLRERADQPIIGRRYRVWFADPARVLWTQHFPCRLYTQAPMTDAIDEQLGDKITMTYDWAVLSATQPLWFVHLPVEHGASFFDFVVWYTDQNGGYFAYDYAAAGYTLTGTRDTSAKPLEMFGDDLGRVELIVPDTPRHTVDVCNSYAEGAKTVVGKQDQSATGIRHDRLMRSSIAQDTDDRVSLEKLRLVIPKVEAQVDFGRMPIIALVPGVIVELKAANRWTTGSALLGKTWLVRDLSLRATAIPGPLDADLQLDSTTYTVEFGVRLQQSTDTRAMLPAFKPPLYPAHVEGKVVSEKGDDGDKTYQSTRNEGTSLDEYTVKVPLWADQTVAAPFVPVMGSGNVYLPSYRDERVLLALHLDHARISRLLVWREGAALSMDVQGEQILFGKNPKSNTSVNHIYADDKPVLNVARTNDVDTALICLSEGTLVLHVEEKDA
jgi:hypothetical protein